jgi:hypothetical protein
MFFIACCMRYTANLWICCSPVFVVAQCMCCAAGCSNYNQQTGLLLTCDCCAAMLTPCRRVAAIDVRFRDAWEQQLQTKGPKQASLFSACASAVGPLFWAALPFKLFNDASQFVGPVILNRLLTVVAGASSQNGPLGEVTWPDWLQWLNAPLSNGYCLAFLLFFGTTLGVLADNQHFQRVMRAGFRLKAIVTAEVYRKVGQLHAS